MENNDLGYAWDWSRRAGVMFEHVLAEPPTKREAPPLTLGQRLWGKRQRQQEAVEAVIDRWTINEIPLRSLRRLESRGMPIEVYTIVFGDELSVAAVETAVQHRLLRWGLQTAKTIGFTSVTDLVKYIGSTLEVRYCWVPQDIAWRIGPRATAVTSASELRP